MRELIDLEEQGWRALSSNADAARDFYGRMLLEDAVMVFIAPPTLSELERRLRGRGTDSEEKIQKRLARAREEIRAMREFDFVVVNDDLYGAVEDFSSIIRAERARAYRLGDADIAAFLTEDREARP